MSFVLLQIKQTAFEFTRPEIDQLVHEGVLPCRFDVLKTAKYGRNGMT
jgi:hypothetical protein